MCGIGEIVPRGRASATTGNGGGAFTGTAGSGANSTGAGTAGGGAGIVGGAPADPGSFGRNLNFGASPATGVVAAGASAGAGGIVCTGIVCTGMGGDGGTVAPGADHGDAAEAVGAVSTGVTAGGAAETGDEPESSRGLRRIFGTDASIGAGDEEAGGTVSGGGTGWGAAAEPCASGGRNRGLRRRG
jgi:hypothetical protein